METGTPDLELARKFAESVKADFPDQMLSYNCSPSFNWRKHLDDATIAKFQRELGAMGFTFQFITLAGFHALNYSMFDLAHGYAREGMSAYVELQEKEFASESRGYTATKHQREVGTGYFDDIANCAQPERIHPGPGGIHRRRPVPLKLPVRRLAPRPAVPPAYGPAMLCLLLGPKKAILRVLFPIPVLWPRKARPRTGTGPLLRTLPDHLSRPSALADWRTRPEEPVSRQPA